MIIYQQGLVGIKIIKENKRKTQKKETNKKKPIKLLENYVSVAKMQSTKLSKLGTIMSTNTRLLSIMLC
jgi:hypothetical protein